MTIEEILELTNQIENIDGKMYMFLRKKCIRD